jgi:hypothetical protein
LVDTNGDPDHEMAYNHWMDIQTDASMRMRHVHALQNQGDDLTSAAKAAKLALTKEGTGHNPSACSTCQAYAGLPPV